jgi:aminopeptidase N
MKTFLTRTIFLGCLFLNFSIYSQGENSTHCSKKDAFKNKQLKSNTLSISQISQTEKYDVHFYFLDVSLTNLSTEIGGTVEIHATARENLDSALFELFQTFNITEIRVDGTPVQFGRNLSAVKAPVNATTGQTFIIAIDYNGTPPTAATNPLGGSGMTNASSPSWGNQVTWSLSQPFSAYEWWPCKQSLTDKADSCSVWITVPSTCKAGSNGILKNVTDLGNGTSRYEWKHRHAIDYYLISVAVAEYVEYNVYANPVGSATPVLIQNYIYNNPQTLPNFQADIDETTDFLELFSELFGPYPFADEKYGHCMAPISGGMEHQTMTSQGFFEKSLTAHELGHQWFGDHVTCASWADIWVNEGFASYSEQLMLENLYPSEAAQNMLEVHNDIKSQTGGSVWVQDSLNENRIFSGRLTYNKGAAIIHTARFMLNDDELFFGALQNFQQDFADSVARGMDVKEAWEQASGIDMTNFFNEWYYGEGYPTYSTKWNSTNGSLHLQINQTTSKPSVTPLFTNPLEIKFARQGALDTTIRFAITSNSENFVIPSIGTVTGISGIDPNNWVINSNGTNVYDGNFLAEINSLTASNTIAIYPNPASEQVFISLSDNRKVSVWLSDINGKILRTTTLEGNGILKINDFNKGPYIVLIKDESTGVISKQTLIIE